MASDLMFHAGAMVPMDLGPGQPAVRWSSRARTLEDIQRDLHRIWARPAGPTRSGEGGAADGGAAGGAGEVGERHVSARTSVLNLVVVVRRAEVGTRAAATIAQLTGRLPSRTLVISAADPDGPSWLDAQIQAFCVAPSKDAAETCTEMIYLTAGGEAGRHLDSLIAPLLIHDLPVTLWLPAESGFTGPVGRTLCGMADRLVVDGSRWVGSGLIPLTEIAALSDGRLAISDFALMRQSRWREAIAATFDAPELTPFLHSIRQIAVTYATHDEGGNPGSCNVVKPLYHVAWIAGRLGMHVISPLTPAGGPAAVPVGFDATLRSGRARVAVTLRPQVSGMPEGTTLSVELVAERRGSELRAAVTAEAETVHCRVWLDGVEMLDRRFSSSRRVDVDLLAEAIESTGDDRIERETIRMAAMIVAPAPVTPEVDAV